VTNPTSGTLGARVAKGVGCAGLVVLGVVALFIGGFYVQMLGGPEAIWLNSLPAPDQDKAEVVRARSDARELARSGLASLDKSRILVPGAEVYSATCERGQNNWKVHEGYLHTCDVTSGRFYGLRGDFPSVARALHSELVAAGWTREYDDGLPGLADQYETGHDEYSTPSPGTTPGPITFEDWTWDTSYTHGEQRVHFEFANRLTRDFPQPGLRAGAGSL
jgi:hypothetical protein